MSSLKLEEETADLKLGYTCSFTVCPDLLLAIEFTEHTPFNIALIAEDSQMGLSCTAFVRSLRMVGSTMPIVLLREGSNTSEEQAAHVPHDDVGPLDSQELPMIDFNTPSSKNDIFTAILKKPFTKRDLCDVLRSTLFPSNHRIGEELSSINSDEEYGIFDEDDMSA